MATFVFAKFVENNPRLAVATILNCKHGQFTCLMAIVCSSWTVVNMGTSLRHVTHPLGREDLDYIAGANKMASRSLDGINTLHFPTFPCFEGNLCDLEMPLNFNYMESS